MQSTKAYEMIACHMSMDLMGIQREELLDQVKSVGVGYYMGQAAHALVCFVKIFRLLQK
ncbi:DsrE/DsrF/DrsH-like family protein [Paenibacillus polymyxa]|uniref:DsrE/DsrF/DrsH-like family protein n=1 Tax=Paenibacillus TaxID=44249 RepID=UPI0027D89D7D|nr:DsrE/DsrF/DrsH-like family protein [Paenibacillus polymyxa]